MPAAPMDDATLTLRQRCGAALTHPATLAALALFILNDLAFKAIWPEAWLTGKLSDLAFVIVASPLLAFLLSFVTRDRARSERAALVTAYAGLPLLYAAFNTFAAVHDPIIETLSLARGGPTYSPLDPSDSLVIPLGLALALWVWRRPVPPAAVRRRLALIVAAAAALVSIATSGPGTTTGVRYEGDRVNTPTGTYQVAGGDVLHNGEVVYTTDHLRTDENIWLQIRDTRRLGPRVLTLSPFGITVDGHGTVVVGMGIQGVLVRTPDGEWVPRGTADDFRPTDFSTVGKFRALFSDAHVWGLALTLAVSALVVAILIADFRLRRAWMIPIGVVLAAPSATVWFGLFNLTASLSEGNLAGLLILALMFGVVPVSVMMALAGLQRTREVLQYGLGIAAVALATTAVVWFARYPDVDYAWGQPVSASVDVWHGSLDTSEDEESMAMAMAGLVLATTVVAGSWRRAHYWRSVALAFFAVLVFAFIPFLWWLLLDAGLTFSKIGVGVVAAVVAITLGFYLRPRVRAEEDSYTPPPPPPRRPPVVRSRGRSTPAFLRPRPSAAPRDRPTPPDR